MTSYTGPEGSLAYSYDATNQLTGATGARNESYSYDLNGNRTMPGYQTGPDNRLVSDGTYNYTYDNEGNTLTRTRISDGQVTTFTWDYRNRLTEAVVRDAQGNVLDDEKFTYDANDHRIGVWANGAQQSWTVYDGDTPYLDFDGSGSLTTRYLSDPRAIDAFFAREDGTGNVAWLLTDKLGSVREVVDSGGTVLDAITYDSYGNILNETNAAAGGSFRFTAGAYDSALGLTYLWHRYVANGHWLSEDPLGLGPDSNRTRYVGNNPTNATDLSGLQQEAISPSYLTTAYELMRKEDDKLWDMIVDKEKGYADALKLVYAEKKRFLAQLDDQYGKKWQYAVDLAVDAGAFPGSGVDWFAWALAAHDLAKVNTELWRRHKLDFCPFFGVFQ